MDFDNVWDIDEDVNDGLPYLKSLPIPERYPKEKDVILELSEYDGKLKISLTGSQYTDEGILILARYQNDSLDDFEHYSLSEYGFPTEVISEMDYNSEYDYRAFLWNDLENMQPVVDFAILYSFAFEIKTNIQ